MEKIIYTWITEVIFICYILEHQAPISMCLFYNLEKNCKFNSNIETIYQL